MPPAHHRRHGDLSVHPHVIRTVFVTSPGVRDYQARQTAHGIDVDVAPAGPLDADDLGVRLRDALAGAALPSPQVNLRIVPAIVRHHETGRVRRIGGAAGGRTGQVADPSTRTGQNVALPAGARCAL